MHNPNDELRIFFDIDADIDDTELVKTTIVNILRTIGGEWAICSSHRKNKTSFHFYSKDYKTTLFKLRDLTKKLAKESSWFDVTILYFNIMDAMEHGYCRLPNQSKNAVNKTAPPLILEEGTLADCLITDIEGLKPY